MKKEIIAIHFDIVVPFASPITPYKEELPDITTKREFIRNYNGVKKLRSKLKIKSKIHIMVEERCPCRKETICREYSLKRLKKLFKNNLIKLPKKEVK